MKEKLAAAGNRIRNLYQSDWQVTFVNKYGRSVRIPHLQRYVILVAAITIGALIAAVCLGVLYLHSRQANLALQASIAVSRQRISDLVDENDALMARLVVLKNRLPAGAADGEETVPPAEETPAEETPDEKADKKAIEEEAAGGISNPSAAKPAVSESPAADSSTVVPPPMVALKQFEVVRSPGESALRVRFQIHKTSGWEGAVSGRIFVVLKDDSGLELVAPAVHLQDGVPTRIERGEYFSIARFKPVELKVWASHPAALEQATVFVFLPDGKLLHQQDFDVNIKPVPDAPPRESAHAPGETRETTAAPEESPAAGDAASAGNADALFALSGRICRAGNGYGLPTWNRVSRAGRSAAISVKLSKVTSVKGRPAVLRI